MSDKGSLTPLRRGKRSLDCNLPLKSEVGPKHNIPEVSVVIVGYNNPSDVRRCLEALSNSVYTSFEVIICENGQQNHADRFRASIPDTLTNGQLVTLVFAPKNLGFAGGVNLAISRAAPDTALWILNPDTEAAPDALLHLMRRLDEDDCEAVGCRMMLPNGLVQSYGGQWNKITGQARSIGFGTLPTKSSPNNFKIDQNYLNGASMLVSRAFFRAVGPMREDYFLYCEEVEWFLRGAKKGMKISYCDQAEVLHYHGTTTGFGDGLGKASPMAVFLSERNRLLVTWDCTPLYIISATSASAALLIWRCVTRRAFHQIKPGLHGLLAGMLNDRRMPEYYSAKRST